MFGERTGASYEVENGNKSVPWPKWDVYDFLNPFLVFLPGLEIRGR